MRYYMHRRGQDHSGPAGGGGGVVYLIDDQPTVTENPLATNYDLSNYWAGQGVRGTNDIYAANNRFKLDYEAGTWLAGRAFHKMTGLSPSNNHAISINPLAWNTGETYQYFELMARVNATTPDTDYIWAQLYYEGDSTWGIRLDKAVSDTVTELVGMTAWDHATPTLFKLECGYNGTNDLRVTVTDGTNTGTITASDSAHVGNTRVGFGYKIHPNVVDTLEADYFRMWDLT